jgi:hypothetical protein
VKLSSGDLGLEFIDISHEANIAQRDADQDRTNAECGTLPEGVSV